MDDSKVTFVQRLRCVAGLLMGLRVHDFRAATTWMKSSCPEDILPVRVIRFICWSLKQMVCSIPPGLKNVTWARSVSTIPHWLTATNPLKNHPWKDNPGAALPSKANVVVIGAGFTGSSLAYHWSKIAGDDQRMVVLEMDDAASGASGRNAGDVVMGRYYAMVRSTVKEHFQRTRKDLSDIQRGKLANQFAAVYSKAAYKNADMIEQTIRDEGYDCDYHRNGTTFTTLQKDQAAMREAIEAGRQHGFDDYTSISAQEAHDRVGLLVDHDAGVSQGAASFQPAKWVWSLLQTALKASCVAYYSRTKVLKIVRHNTGYRITTTRGDIDAQYVVNAVESCTPLLHKQFHNVIQPVQTQVAFGVGGPESLKPHRDVGVPFGFVTRNDQGIILGTDNTILPDRLAGSNKPSRFMSKFVLGQIRQYLGPFKLHVTHEWSGTPGFSVDGYPVVGVMDGYQQYIIGGMCGSGTGVAFNASRCICNRILGNRDEPDDYPEAYFAPSRLLDPANHTWPDLDKTTDEKRSH